MDVIAEHRGVVFAIEHEGRPIGQANYRDLQPKGKSAEVGIGIGEPALWGKGLGREALGLLVKHLVDDLGVHRVTLSVLAYNDRAISSYKAAGFEVEGIERDGVMTDRGTCADDVKMAYVVGRARPGVRSASGDARAARTCASSRCGGSTPPSSSRWRTRTTSGG